jgi:DNA-binding response OmpR family regulator
MRLLLIEDSPRLQRSLGTGLRRAGHAVDVVGDGVEGLSLAESTDYDLLILDLMLPGLDGLSLLRRLREQEKQTHVLILTARDTLEDRVKGLNAGADDFLVKPFAFEELLARVQALGRRRHGQKNPRIVVGAIEIDTVGRKVSRDGQLIALAPREYALLEYLAVRRGRVVTRAEIEEHLYDGRSDPMSNVVDSAICALRRRIDRAGEPSLIETRRGSGYVLEAGSRGVAPGGGENSRVMCSLSWASSARSRRSSRRAKAATRARPRPLCSPSVRAASLRQKASNRWGRSAEVSARVAFDTSSRQPDPAGSSAQQIGPCAGVWSTGLPSRLTRMLASRVGSLWTAAAGGSEKVTW